MSLILEDEKLKYMYESFVNQVTGCEYDIAALKRELEPIKGKLRKAEEDLEFYKGLRDEFTNFLEHRSG